MKRAGVLLVFTANVALRSAFVLFAAVALSNELVGTVHPAHAGLWLREVKPSPIGAEGG